MKRKVTVDREKLSSEQINARMNFDSVLAKVSPIPFYKTGWFITTLASVAVILTVALVSFETSSANEQTQNEPSSETLASPPPMDNMSFEYEEDTKCFNPPIKELDIPFETAEINNSTEQVIVTSNQTELIIPKNALVTSNGNPVNGNIEIKYREFHNPIEIFQSGIPMKYDSAGVEYTFESGGMIEIYGFQNGEPIAINPDKPIAVKFKNKDKNTALNLYDFDTVANQWKYKGKPDFEANAVANDDLRESNLTQNVWDEHNSPQEEENRISKEEVAEAKTTYETIKADNKEFKKESPKKPKTIENPNNVFVLNIDPKEFPEFDNYTETKFEIDKINDWVNPSVFTTDWDNAKLSQHESKGNYLLTLTTKKDEEKIIVHPVLAGADLAKAQKLFENDFKTYQNKLDDRLKAEAEAKEYYEKKKQLYEEQLKAQKQRELLLAEQKKIMTEQAKVFTKKNEIKRQFTTTFSVTQFGTWNCDSPVRPPRGIELATDFIDKNNQPIQLVSINLIERGRNAVFDFTGRTLRINPKEDNILFGMTIDNKVAAISPTQLKIHIADKKNEIQMKVYETPKEAIAELKDIVLG